MQVDYSTDIFIPQRNQTFKSTKLFLLNTKSNKRYFFIT